MELEAIDKENMNVMQVPTSPSFLKPKPIKLRKRPLTSNVPLPLNEVDVNKNAVGYIAKSPKVVHNPFKRDRIKRKRELEDICDEDSNSLLWKQVNKVSEYSEESIGLPSPVVPSMLDECALSAFSEDIAASFKPLNEKVADKPKTKSLPLDWSLKTRIRFSSSSSFPSRGTFRTFEEVNGTIGFVRCLHSGETDKKSSDLHSSHGAKFFQHCLVWMHPVLPWLNLFPRNESPLSKSNMQDLLFTSSVTLDPVAQANLHSDWCNSFRSLYQLVRLYQCPYFYMCAPTFTILFRCAGASSIPVLHALITPTTKGFRKALKEEGITFTMPLCQNNGSESGFEDLIEDSPPSSSNSNDWEDEGLVRDLEANDEDEPHSWLESLGLSQEDFPALSKKKRREDTSFRIDNKPESLVYVEDSETQALVNFLLNSHFCISKIGPMAGVPPTLLAPTAFLGGTLQALKIRHGKVKTENKEFDSIEVSGPLLPNTVHSLCSLFSSTQESGFSVVLTPHTPTTTFTMVNPQSPMLPCIFAKNNLTDCGMPETFVNQMCSKTAESAINNITLEDGLFTWS